MPSATFQPAGAPSFTFVHWSSDLPSNSTIASDGGDAVSLLPGVTTGTAGDQTSVSSGFGLASCAMAANGAIASNRLAPRRIDFIALILSIGSRSAEPP